MKTLVLENREIVNYLESLSMEIAARQDVVAFMLDRGMDTGSAQFKAYHRELVEFKVQFEAAKKKLEEEFVIPNADGKTVNWSLDYESGVLTVEDAGR